MKTKQQSITLEEFETLANGFLAMSDLMQELQVLFTHSADADPAVVSDHLCVFYLQLSQLLQRLDPDQAVEFEPVLTEMMALYLATGAETCSEEEEAQN
jgi:hypothetical protein